MKFTLKNYKTIKTKKYIKTTNIYFFFNGIKQNSSNRIQIEQELKNINFSCYKIFNKTSIKILENSVFKNAKPIINGTIFFIKPKSNKPISKKILLNNFENLMFVFLAAKINKKIYLLNQIKNIHIINYYKNKLLLYQFIITHLKSYFNQ